MNQERVMVAFHESGHCVASLVLFGRATGAALFDCDGATAGLAGNDLPAAKPPTQSADPADHLGDFAEAHFREAFDEAVWLAAGDAAARLWRGESYLPFRVSQSDNAKVEALARRCFGTAEVGTVGAFADLAYRRAMALLWPRWRAVTAVAEALAEHGRLTAGEVALMIAQNI